MSRRTIPRNRLVPSHLKKVFNCDIEYLVDQFGQVYYPEQWLRELAARPYYYTIVKKLEPEATIDAEKDPDYMGDSSVFIERVPLEVDKVSLEAWIKRGMQSETGAVQKMRDHVTAAEKMIYDIESKIQELPFVDIEDARNEKEAAKGRKELHDLLTKEADMWGERLQKRKKKLKRVEEDLVYLDINLRLYEKDIKSGTHTWIADVKSKKLASKMCSKEDWILYKLALFVKGQLGDPDKPAEVIYGRDAEFPVDYMDDQRVVNMRLARITRRRHGHGGLVHEHDNELRVTPNWFYRGEFSHGKRHGKGKCWGSASTFEGDWEDDNAKGEGVIQFADGGKWEGKVGCQMQGAPSLINGNEYAMGVPHGDGKYTFPNGSLYTGNCYQGKITGDGTFTTSHKVMKGSFRDGRLHGGGSSEVKLEDGDEVALRRIDEGNWRGGLLHSEGRRHMPNGTTYSGKFRDGIPYGLGRLYCHMRCRRRRFVPPEAHASCEEVLHEGLWRSGMRQGYGELFYGDRMGRLEGTGQDPTAWSEERIFKDLRRGMPLRCSASWDNDFMDARGLHATKVKQRDGTRSTVEYTYSKKAGSEPEKYKRIYAENKTHRKALQQFSRTENREWRERVNQLKKVLKFNIRSYRRALQEQRVAFFDEDLWELLTPEEQALELNQKMMMQARRSQQDLKVAYRKGTSSRTST